MSKRVFVSGTKIGENTVKFRSEMIPVGHSGDKKIKKTTCSIVDSDNNVIASNFVKRFSKDQDITYVARRKAAEKTIKSIDDKQLKQQVLEWYLPLIQK